MPFSFFCPPFPPIITSYAKITFVHFYVKKVTKVIFRTFKNSAYFGPSPPSPAITPKIARILKALSVKYLARFMSKIIHKNRQNHHKNGGKRPTITP